jgi:hypothetical protein
MRTLNKFTNKFSLFTYKFVDKLDRVDSRNRYPINGNNELMLCFHDFQGWGKKVTMLSALKLHPLISCKQQSRMRVINLRQHRMSETLV